MIDFFFIFKMVVTEDRTQATQDKGQQVLAIIEEDHRRGQCNETLRRQTQNLQASPKHSPERLLPVIARNINFQNKAQIWKPIAECFIRLMFFAILLHTHEEISPKFLFAMSQKIANNYETGNLFLFRGLQHLVWRRNYGCH